MTSFDIVTNLPRPPVRPDDAHKGTFGTVIIVGGCPTMIGAPGLAASAALRGGAGLVKIASTAGVVPFALTIEPGATGIVIDDEIDRAAAAIDQADPQGTAVLAVGPGMGPAESAGRLVRRMLASGRCVVLDADGLNHMAAEGLTGATGPLVMTPHPGEFRRLARQARITADRTDPETRPDAAAQMARLYKSVVVLKGTATVVTNGTRMYVNRTGNAALATAGSGDVLTGLISALMAQGMAPFEAAALGAHLHGRAGDLWCEQYGPGGLTARDLAGLLPNAFQEARQKSS